MDRDAEEAFSNTVQEAYDTAMQTQQNVTPAEKLKAMTTALTDHADTVIKEAQDKLRLRKEGNKFKGGRTVGTDEDRGDQGRSACHYYPFALSCVITRPPIIGDWVRIFNVTT